MKHLLIIFFALISFPLFAQQQEEDSTLFFENNKLNYEPMNTFFDGWYITPGESKLDSAITYNGKKSLLLTSDPKQVSAIYYISFDDIIADSISFSCKYKLDPANHSTLYLYINQRFNNPNWSMKHDTLSSIYAIPDPEKGEKWQELSIKEKIKHNVEGVFINATVYGDSIKVWINDCKASINNQPLSKYVNVKYKADEDREFDKASGIRLSPLTPEMVENLEILGKVWGFLKYYHPEVAKGNYNWDYELFRVLPQIANAKNQKERNKLLNQWVDKYGEITEFKDYSISDSTMYSHIISLNWLNDKKMFDNELISKFNRIRNAKRDKFHYYIQTYRSRADMDKRREPPYSNILWDDQGFRLLTLFKFWNAMEYNFPFVEITDKPWNPILKEFISRFAEPKDKKDYELTLRELFACINDSHVNFTSSSDLLSGSWSDVSTLPVQLAYTFDQQVVVKYSLIDELKPGDIITRVDNEDIDSIFEQKSRYRTASNRSYIVYSILYGLLSTPDSELTVTCLRSGKENTSIIDMTPYKGKLPFTPPPDNNYEDDYKLASKSIAYVNYNTMTDDSIVDFIKKIKWQKELLLI